MQVRLKTSPIGMCFRIISLLILGGLAAVLIQQTDWYKTNAVVRQPAAVVQPAPAAVPAPVPAAVVLAPAPVKATVHRPSAATPPGWINFMGILIPPSGWNDTHR
jgi:hypothetical protein